MGYLKNDEIERIIGVFKENQGQNYKPQTRENYLGKIDRNYVTEHLSDEINNQYEQLERDLATLNSIRQLKNGEIPLRDWLKEAERRFKTLPQSDIFKDLLEKVAPDKYEESFTDGNSARTSGSQERERKNPNISNVKNEVSFGNAKISGSPIIIGSKIGDKD